MARARERITARAIPGLLRKPGMHIDGQSLYLNISEHGSASWIFRYTVNGHRRNMGLGAYPEISLMEARGRAAIQRRLLHDGQDPLEQKRAVAIAAAIEAAKMVTFEQCADQYLRSMAPGWRRSEGQWRQTLRDYVYPTIGSLPVASIDTGLVIKTLEPIWQAMTETANRVRRRIEAILSFATASGYRQGENPARWKDHLEYRLQKPSKLAKPEHFAAMPYGEIGAFIVELRARDTVAARALEFVILTAARAGEALGATWEETDLANRVWTVPANRIKAGREHRVPLSDAAVAVLQSVNGDNGTGLIFRGPYAGGKIADARLRDLLRDLGRSETVHGFRSTFSQWAADCTNYSYETREMALAHNVGSQVERSYQRSDLFDRRRRLMDEWARFCAMPTSTGAVVPIHSTA
jgi:integrase